MTQPTAQRPSLSLVLAFAMIMSVFGLGTAKDLPRIAPGADVVIKITIQVPEERLIITDKVSQYTHGQQQLLPVIEDALVGKQAGETTHLDLSPDRAFGPYDETRKVSIAREKVPAAARVGEVSQTSEGIPFTILELSDRSALVDFNHPLAGKHVVLDVTVLEVKQKS